MIILGLSLEETSTAALMVDGEVLAAVSEERFSRRKNDESFPLQAIDYCLKAAGIESHQLDLIAIATSQLTIYSVATRNYSTFSMKDQLRAMHEYWYPRLYENRDVSWFDVFADKIDTDQFPGNLKEILAHRDRPLAELSAMYQQSLHEAISKRYGVPQSKIVHFDHHSCHAAYAYWGSPYREGDTLVVTADAYGDGLSATLSRGNRQGVTRLHGVPHTEFRLARLYRYMTLVLGMKPNEHEYKVMGLAPYSKPETMKAALEIFRATMAVDGLGFKWKENPKDMYFYFREKLEGCRFDGIAGALQTYTEEILTQWFRNAIQQTGLRRITYSGGISMNIKANKCLHEMAEVEDLYVCGTGSDESLAIGVCYLATEQNARKAGRPFELRPVQPYLGPSYDETSVEKWLAERQLQNEFKVEKTAPEGVAKFLADGNVVGRVADRMEFGQRALGNRSIIADPRNFGMIDKINHKIKNRDFWMPFAPSVLAECADEYFVNPKGIRCPAMTIGFDSTDLGRRHLPAALHPADRTLRPNVVSREWNAGYHQLLSAFKKHTGVGALLNTSFNLHGQPIVCTPEDGLYVFRNSGLDGLLVGDYLIQKKANG